jgi:hypothetical protein
LPDLRPGNASRGLAGQDLEAFCIPDERRYPRRYRERVSPMLRTGASGFDRGFDLALGGFRRAGAGAAGRNDALIPRAGGTILAIPFLSERIERWSLSIPAR